MRWLCLVALVGCGQTVDGPPLKDGPLRHVEQTSFYVETADGRDLIADGFTIEQVGPPQEPAD